MDGVWADRDGRADEALGGRADEGAVNDRMPDPRNGKERRMHVRAYNHWVSLLKGRAYPVIEDLEPEGVADFGPYSVLLDFGADAADPAIAYLGGALRAECGLDRPPARIADVPARSLLSRLTDHHLQIIANRAPIGFEAEFTGARGMTTRYRGILMPFASAAGEEIDFIYGVINWTEAADPATQAGLAAELEAAMRSGPRAGGAAVWADGPGADAGPEGAAYPLGEQPAIARLALETEAAAGETVVLVARVGEDGVLDVVAHVRDVKLAERALGRVAGAGRSGAGR